jgi:hypothetical protein
MAEDPRTKEERKEGLTYEQMMAKRKKAAQEEEKKKLLAQEEKKEPKVTIESIEIGSVKGS